MSRLKRFIFLLLVLPLLGLGCGGSNADGPESIKSIRLDYWTVYNDVDVLKKFAREYNQLHQYVNIDVRQLRYEEFDTKFTNALADGVGPDIVSINTRDLNRQILRLSEVPKKTRVYTVEKTSKFKDGFTITPVDNGMPSEKDIYTAYIAAVSDNAIVNNKAYGLPLSADAMVVYYNKRLLDKAGVPQPPTNWKEFAEAVKAATKFDNTGRLIQSGVALGTGTNTNNAFDIFSTLILQKGAKLQQGKHITFAGGIAQSGYEHPTLEVLHFYTNFANPRKDVYSWNEKQENSLTAFTRQKSVFYFGYAFDKSRIMAQAPGIELGVIEIPQLNEASPVASAQVWLESVTRDSEHQNEAWDFIRYITQPSKAIEYAKAVKAPSPYRAHIKQMQESEDFAPFANQLLFAQSWYRGKNYPEAQEAFSDLMTQYLAPHNPKVAPLKRDRGLVEAAAGRIQQTY